MRKYIDVSGHWDVYVVYGVLFTETNQGFTYTDTNRKVSVVVIGNADSYKQFLNTIVHEAKHVQTAICGYYGIDESSEDAAYLIGYLVMRMV